MEQRVSDIISRMRVSAEVIGDKTEKAYKAAADSAGKMASDVVESTRLNLKILEINAETDQLYKEVGKIVYDMYQGIDTDDEELRIKLSIIDEKLSETEQKRAKIRDIKSACTCPRCGKQCRRYDSFCSMCGAQL